MSPRDSAIIDSLRCRMSFHQRRRAGDPHYNGPGPYKIANNYLEGSGENVVIGGADIFAPQQRLCLRHQTLTPGPTEAA